MSLAQLSPSLFLVAKDVVHENVAMFNTEKVATVATFHILCWAQLANHPNVFNMIKSVKVYMNGGSTRTRESSLAHGRPAHGRPAHGRPTRGPFAR
jgi:hypothetical protein